MGGTSSTLAERGTPQAPGVPVKHPVANARLIGLIALVATLLLAPSTWAEGGLVASKAEVTAKTTLFEAYSSSYAVVIGIDNYQHFTKLSGAARDARAMAGELSRRGFEVITLVNEEATRRGILRALQVDLPKRVGPQDRVLIYFAGHGISQGEGAAAMGYLMPVEASPEAPSVDGIDMESLQRVLATQYKAKHILYVADACYSGLALSTRGAGLSSDSTNYLKQIVSRPVKLAFAAGAAGEEAHEWRGHGLFTYHFLEGLRGAADRDADGLITSAELWPYLQREVTSVSARKGWSQTPQYGRSGEGEFVFFAPGGTPSAQPAVAVAPRQQVARGAAGVVLRNQSAASEQSNLGPWTVTGAGVAAAAVGAGLAVLGYGQRDDLSGRLGDPGGTVAGLSLSEAERLQSKANDNIMMGNVLLGVGAAAAAAGITWWLVGEDEESSGSALAGHESARASWQLQWAGSGLSLRSRF
jgi:uncharacterized caspase-like protein